MKKVKIEPSVIATIDMHGYYNIPIIVSRVDGELLDMTHINKFQSNYLIRQKLINELDNFIQKYEIDTILYEQNLLFTDTISKYPDPSILRDIKLGFGIQTSIEDKYWNTVKYILSIPSSDWHSKIFNAKVKYSIDLYKSHISRSVPQELLDIIDTNNYYKAICLSESTLFDSLMNNKYQVNKEIDKVEKE